MMNKAVRKLGLVCGVGAVMMMALAPVQAKRNPLDYPKDFKVRCVNKGDPAALAVQAFRRAVEANSTLDERELAFTRFDSMLSSMYGLKVPLSTVKPGPGRDALARAAFLALNGYVISARMAQGSMAREGHVPNEISDVSGTMIYRLIEPYPEAVTLQRFWDRSLEADRELDVLPRDRKNYAKWLIRGVIYADPIAIESGLAGYCASGPSELENRLIERIAGASDLKKKAE